MSTPVAVLAAGSRGTVLPHLLSPKGNDVHLWAIEPDVARSITECHENPTFLADVDACADAARQQ